MADRYFVDVPIAGPDVAITGVDAHHLIHVMRAKQGERVVLFDGSGSEFAARIERVGRAEVVCTVESRSEISRELPWSLTLGVALPKGDRQRWLVEKAVELGVGRLVPLETARAVAQVGHNTHERLRRTVIEASKQCGRNRLMHVADPVAWPEFVAEPDVVIGAGPGQAGPVDGWRLLAHPGAPGFLGDKPPLTGPVSAAVGPEGGFTDDEVQAALSAGWRAIGLGERILRVETAAIYLTALVVAMRAATAGTS